MSSPASGCQSTPTVKRFPRAGSQRLDRAVLGARGRPGVVRPSAEAAAAPDGGADLDRSPRSRAAVPAEPRAAGRASATSCSANSPGHVLVLAVSGRPRLGEVLDEVAPERDVQHLRAAADPERRQVALERRPQQHELSVVAERKRPVGLCGWASRRRRAPGRGWFRAAREDEPVDARRASRPLPRSSGGTEQRPPRRRARTART